MSERIKRFKEFFIFTVINAKCLYLEVVDLQRSKFKILQKEITNRKERYYEINYFMVSFCNNIQVILIKDSKKYI